MRGMIDVSRLNCLPEEHEFETAKYFADLGKDIIFLKPSDIPGVHTPDILMDNIEWEIKCPVGSSKRTIEQNFRHAIKQSYYIIFDLRHIKLPERDCIAKLKCEFEARIKMKRLLIIRKNGQLLEMPEN